MEKYPTSDQRPTALYQLAWVLVDLDRESEADEVFEQIHQQYTSSRYWSDATYRLAERAARPKQYEQAETLAGEIIERCSRAAHGCLRALPARSSGGCHAALGRRGAMDASVCWTSIPTSSQQLPAQYWLAESHYRLRQYDEAGPLFEQLDQQTAELSDAWVAMIPLRRAQVLAHQRKWDEAIEIASQIAHRFPEFTQQHEVDYLLGRYHASRARVRRGTRMRTSG